MIALTIQESSHSEVLLGDCSFECISAANCTHFWNIQWQGRVRKQNFYRQRKYFQGGSHFPRPDKGGTHEVNAKTILIIILIQK